MNEEKRPNILLIQADQLSPFSLGLYGNPVVKTPSIEALAVESVVFNKAYCNYPLCVPSRTSMMTGQFPSTIGSYENALHMNPAEVSLPLVLRQAGYRTAMVGKNHAFTDGSSPDVHGGNRFFDHPEATEKKRCDELHRIFDIVCEADHGAGVEGCMYNEEVLDYWRWVCKKVWLKGDMTHGVNPYDSKCSSSYLLGEKACQVLQELSAGNQPFFMWLSYPDPHTPYQVSEPYASMYKPEEVPKPLEDTLDNKPERHRIQVEMTNKKYSKEAIQEIRALHYGMISQMDDSIGRVIDSLKSTGLWENTIVVFTADHGDSMGDHGVMQKHNFFYDSFTRVPLTIRIPGTKSRYTNSLVSLIDLLPTILSLVKLPPLPQAQGINLSSFLKGDSEDTQPYIMMECGDMGDEKELVNDRGFEINRVGGLGRGISLRTKKYKLNAYENDLWEIYNMEDDPEELNNLYGTKEGNQCINQLSKTLIQNMLRIKDRNPVNRKIRPNNTNRRIFRWSPINPISMDN